MMKAIKFSQYIQDREDLKFVDSPHWIYVLEAVIFSLMILGAGLMSHNFLAANFIYPALQEGGNVDDMIAKISAYLALASLWGGAIFAALYFISKCIFFFSTYVFATDRRIYMKTGLIRVLVNEVSFDEVHKTDINYGLIGRFLGYGKLMMDARFVEDTDLPFTYYPETFAKLIHHHNDLIDDVNLSFATQQMKDHGHTHIPAQREAEGEVETARQQEQSVQNFQKKHTDVKTSPDEPSHDIPDEFDEAVNDETPHRPAQHSLHTSGID